MLYNPRPRKEYAEETPGRPVLIDGYWHIEWTPARTGHQAITPYGWPTKEQAERAIAAHKERQRINHQFPNTVEYGRA